MRNHNRRLGNRYPRGPEPGFTAVAYHHDPQGMSGPDEEGFGQGPRGGYGGGYGPGPHGGNGPHSGPGPHGPHGGNGTHGGNGPHDGSGPHGGHGGGYGNGPRGPGRGAGRGRAGRGQIRAAVLLLLTEQPRHGYDLLTEITDRSEGRLSPSPGSIYPLLTRLTAAGLVRAETDEGRRTFSLTDEGRAYVEQNRERWGVPWEGDSSAESDSAAQLHHSLRRIKMAVVQLSDVGTADQLTRAEEILASARKEIYGLLAE